MQGNIFKIWGRATNFCKCEKTNQTIINSLKLMCKDQSHSAQNITPVLMAYRATVPFPTGISPHYASFGTEMNLGIDSERS